MTTLGRPILGQRVGRAMCAVPTCWKRALMRSKYCLDCELEGVGRFVSEAHEPGPKPLDHRVHCLLCPFDKWLQLTRAEAERLRLPACPRCRGRLLLEEDAGGIGSPWITERATEPDAA